MKTSSFLFSILLTVVAITALPTYALENSLKTFETDGCTMFVDGPAKKPGLWKHCCVEHDMRYWFGGSKKDMDLTDLRLKSCINEVAGNFWAQLIYKGVRAGHSSPVKNKTYWSWGWTDERKDKELSPEESQYVIEELRRLPYDRDVIEKFIELNFKISHAEI